MRYLQNAVDICSQARRAISGSENQQKNTGLFTLFFILSVRGRETYYVKYFIAAHCCHPSCESFFHKEPVLAALFNPFGGFKGGL